MAYLKNNVNVFLLLLIILIIAAFMSFTLYYNNKYSNLTAEYENTIDDLNRTLYEKTLRERQLNQTLIDFEQRIIREQDLTSMYSDIKGANLNLTTELQDKITALAAANAELRKTKDDLTAASQLLTTRTNELAAANSRIDDLEQEIDELEDDLAVCMAP